MDALNSLSSISHIYNYGYKKTEKKLNIIGVIDPIPKRFITLSLILRIKTQNLFLSCLYISD